MFRAFFRPSSGVQCSGSLWFYLRIVVIVVLCSVKPEAATAVIELLMMGGKTPETR
jgi:hypothetical protein